MLKDDYIKCEKINNVIYEQPPAEGFTHALVMGNVLFAIKSQLKGSEWIITAGNFPLKLSADEYAVPDIMLFKGRQQITSEGYQGIPDFIAEIERPLTRAKDRTVKMNAYAKLGVEEYWLIDPTSKKIEIYYLQAGKYVLQDSYVMEDNKKNPACSKEVSISLKNVPAISMTIENVFYGIYAEDNQ